jgi:hypothetical protein
MGNPSFSFPKVPDVLHCLGVGFQQGPRLFCVNLGRMIEFERAKMNEASRNYRTDIFNILRMGESPQQSQGGGEERADGFHGNGRL